MAYTVIDTWFRLAKVAFPLQMLQIFDEKKNPQISCAAAFIRYAARGCQAQIPKHDNKIYSVSAPKGLTFA